MVKNKNFILLACLCLAGCMTPSVQVARLDKTRSPTNKIDFYKGAPVTDRKYNEVAYLSVANVTEKNYTAALGHLMDEARKVGADALILRDPSMIDGTNVLSGIAVAYE